MTRLVLGLLVAAAVFTGVLLWVHEGPEGAVGALTVALRWWLV